MQLVYFNYALGIAYCKIAKDYFKQGFNNLYLVQSKNNLFQDY